MPNPPRPDDILEALRPIVDPDFGKSIVELGFVKNIEIDGSRVCFDIELTTPACPVKEAFQRDARERVGALPGVEEVDVNLIGPCQMIRAAAPALRAQEGGAVVNISSIAGVDGSGSSVTYAASKGALNTMTLSLARALAPQIRVNAICPGHFNEENHCSEEHKETDMSDLKDWVAIVTGSASGIGRSTALMLAKRGAKVVINCRTSTDAGNGCSWFATPLRMRSNPCCRRATRNSRHEGAAISTR